jgi:hypothetical protein
MIEGDFSKSNGKEGSPPIIAALPFHEMNGQQVFLNEMKQHPHQKINAENVDYVE